MQEEVVEITKKGKYLYFEGTLVELEWILATQDLFFSGYPMPMPNKL
ncbi:MAG TPA: hypothetical protein VK072_00330 [Candidatus Avamphibacillus sp.]|nr:hypothetical protein [Candidatus Avamphibacillus sp.]